MELGGGKGFARFGVVAAAGEVLLIYFLAYLQILSAFITL